MNFKILALILLLIGCNNKPEQKKWYPEICQGCGTEYESNQKPTEPLLKCPQCPLDLCVETVGIILTLGTINEIVAHQPLNESAKDKQADLEKRLKNHLESCEKCRNSLNES